MQTNSLRMAFLDSITSLADVLEARDKYTSGHSQRVASIATAIAEEMNLCECQVQKIRLASMVHDIGKIGIEGYILNKPSSLTPEEYDVIKTHCDVGERILAPVIKDPVVLKMVRYHHERYDGKGYPDSLKLELLLKTAEILGQVEQILTGREQKSREEMPFLGACIIAVADSFDAMTTDRPYRVAMSIDESCQELRKQQGQQFDPVVVDAFLGLVNRTGRGLSPDSLPCLSFCQRLK